MERAKKRVIFILQAIQWRDKLRFVTHKFYTTVEYIKQKMTSQFLYNEARMDFLRRMWNKELADYVEELSHSKQKPD